MKKRANTTPGKKATCFSVTDTSFVSGLRLFRLVVKGKILRIDRPGSRGKAATHIAEFIMAINYLTFFWMQADLRGNAGHEQEDR